jgi:hypothetical protein
LRWYHDKVSRAYWPFIVEVTAKAADSLTFFLLNKTSGERAHANALSGNPNDATKMYNHLPSTAQDADPGDANRNCGFLFLTRDYLDAQVSSGQIDKEVLTLTQGDSKWPKGAAALAAGINRLLAHANRDLLDKDEDYAIQMLLSEIS